MMPTCRRRARSPRMRPAAPSSATAERMLPLPPLLTSERIASPGCEANVESTAAEAAAAAVLAQRGNAGDTLAARSIRASKVTCLVAVYGSCLLKVAGTPRSSPVAPSASYRREAAPSSPKPVYLHAYTHTRRVAHHADARRLRRREDERGEAAGDDGRRDRAERRRLLHAEPEGEEGRGSGRLERLICAKLERAFRAVADDGGREAREQGGCAFLLEHATQAREQ